MLGCTNFTKNNKNVLKLFLKLFLSVFSMTYGVNLCVC
nr:MAG TPA: hypothetical protein [Caudoviricetes sp.]